MKIALVIFRFGPSHGSILQTYALTRTLEKLGHKVTIIDRQKPIGWSDVDICIRRVVKNMLSGRFSFHDFYFGSFSTSVMSKLNGFIESELKAQTITLSSDNELKKIGSDNYDAYIVGSDQTWRPKYVYNIYDYYLEFVPKERKVKRIAYASSFGTLEWEYTKEQECRCKTLLSFFNGVSVREDDGVVLCKKHFNVDAEHVLDPTMLLKGADYQQFVKIQSGDKYLGYIFLDFTSEKKAMVEMISKSLGLTPRQLVSMGDETRSNKERTAPSINDWLSGIYNSRFLIVDSFHATVFSIILHKDFLAVGNVARGLSRFTSLLNMFDLGNRLVLNIEEISDSLIRESINWDKVDKILEFKRVESISFLTNSLMHQ